jgi:two-component system phosphate regulon response regulator OmpR
MTDSHHIVIVDDDHAVRETFSEYLSLQNFQVSEFEGAAGLRALVDEGSTFDLAILDIAMPGEDGLSLARFLRERTNAGIIMVTASGEPVDVIVGLEMGADDYISKPVNLRELLARIKSVLRRLAIDKKRDGQAEPTAPREDTVRFGRCRLNLGSRQLHDEDGQEIPTTAMEFDLLSAFAERPNRVLSRDFLLDLAHNRERDAFDRSIDIRIARLRRKIEVDPGKPRVIKTVRGAGYMFVSNDGGTPV